VAFPALTLTVAEMASVEDSVLYEDSFPILARIINVRLTVFAQVDEK
jgi:hypothetical protein